MNGTALALVLASAALHSVWNVQLKRAGDKLVFSWLLTLTGVLWATPVWALRWREYASFPPQIWLLAIAAGACYAGYFALLGLSYRDTTVSAAYPIVRGVGPLGAMLLGVLLLDEALTPAGALAALLIVASVVALAWPDRAAELDGAATAGVLYAILTGLCAAAYSVIDKQIVTQVDAVLYLPVSYGVSAVLLAPLILRRGGGSAVRGEWRRGPLRVASAGLMAFVGYLLVLFALQRAPVAYVVPVRSVSVVATVLLGALYLQEGRLGRRLALASGVVIGLVVLASRG